LVWSSGL